MISEKCKAVLRITNEFILMGQRKTQVGCAVISDNHSNIPDDSPIFTAEAKAIDLALDFISTCDICIESNEPHQFKKSTDSETFRKMS